MFSHNYYGQAEIQAAMDLIKIDNRASRAVAIEFFLTKFHHHCQFNPISRGQIKEFVRAYAAGCAHFLCFTPPYQPLSFLAYTSNKEELMQMMSGYEIQSPLYLAAEEGDEEKIKDTISQFIKETCHASDKKFDEKEQEQLVKDYMDLKNKDGVDFDGPNEKTALDIAIEKRHFGVAVILLSHHATIRHPENFYRKLLSANQADPHVRKCFHFLLNKLKGYPEEWVAALEDHVSKLDEWVTYLEASKKLLEDILPNTINAGPASIVLDYANLDISKLGFFSIKQVEEQLPVKRKSWCPPCSIL